MWQQDGNQDATERIEEDVVKGESKGPFAKAVEGSGDSGSSSLGLNRSTEMEYQAALPLLIAERSVAVPDDLSARISALLVEMARFDVELGQRADNVPTMLLRSESSASSQIDRLTSTAQSVALAELYPKASSDARLVVANMIATQRALELPAGLSLEGIVEIHDLLLDNSHLENQTNSAFEKLRQKPVWLGGTSFTPHTALFVPPAFQHVPEYMADLIEFGTRSDLNPVVKAAILYAQFKTVHPFLTANGQTGRALIHHIFRAEGVLSSTLIPVSVGFLHNIDSLTMRCSLIAKAIRSSLSKSSSRHSSLHCS